MKYDKIPREELVRKIQVFERELKGYVDRVDQRYKIFFERNLAGMYRSRINGEIVECNDALAQILGYKSREDLIGTDARILYKDIRDRQKHLELLHSDKFVRNRKLALLRKDGSEIWVSISTSEIAHPATGKVEYLEGTIIDITELIHTQDLLARSEENFRSMLEQSPYGIIIHNGGKVRFANKRAAEILSINLSQDQDISPLFPKTVLESEGGHNHKGLQHFDNLKLSLPTDEVYVDLYVKPVIFENEEMIEWSFVDIRDRIKLEEEKIKNEVFKNLNDQLKKEIREKEKIASRLENSLDTNVKQAAKLEAIFENKSHVVWTMDKQERFTSFNKNFADLMKEIFNMEPQINEKPLKYEAFIGRPEIKEWQKKLKQVFSGKPHHFVTHLKGHNGEKWYLQLYLNPIYDQDKKVSEISVIGHDVTAKEMAENKLTESLREKDILLKEIHHRVKNNLQVISSIFNLQIAFNKDERIHQTFKESQNRIKSMAYIHESLYKSSQLGNIDFEEYLNRLAKNLIQSYAMQDVRVTLLTETEKVLLHLDQAIPCGLIVNEVISNSLKYAFQGRKTGIIMIYLHQKGKIVKLRISDDGVGLSDNSMLLENNTLGFHLIHTLVEQLRGELKIDGNNGTSISIDFPVLEPS